MILFAILIGLAGAVNLLAQAVATTPDPATSLTDLITSFAQISGDWKTAGGLGAAIAVVHFLMKLTKLPYIDEKLSEKTWLKPVIGVVLGAAVGLTGALAAGAGLASAVVAGALAGLGSAGWHELMVTFSADKKAQRAVGFTIADLVVAQDSEAIALAAKNLQTIATITDKAERLKALAAWANGHPPATAVNPPPPPPQPPLVPATA